MPHTRMPCPGAPRCLAPGQTEMEDLPEDLPEAHWEDQQDGILTCALPLPSSAEQCAAAELQMASATRQAHVGSAVTRRRDQQTRPCVDGAPAGGATTVTSSCMVGQRCSLTAWRLFALPQLQSARSSRSLLLLVLLLAAQCVQSDMTIVSSAYSWTDAKANCESQGKRLVLIESAAKNEAVRSAADAGGLGEFWLGGTDGQSEGSWLWLDGSPISYTNWNSREPNNVGGAEDCMAMDAGNGKWNDAGCARPRASVCEALSSLNFDGTAHAAIAVARTCS